MRLLGEAAGGNIGADVVLVLAALSTITALPTILAVSVFIAVLTTVTRNYRESEMVVVRQRPVAGRLVQARAARPFPWPSPWPA